ncbi:MAG: TetR/AcrR family transcriptional regulator [Proteobacteria bacterium]|nr:TetR/AcrR family transcriptional regulator [Pseudomonadota bacterium]
MPDDIADNVTLNPKRRAIIDAATELFMERGFGDVSMDTIAARADVSKRTVYSHFENKEHLYEGIMSEACACHIYSTLLTEDVISTMPVREFMTAMGRDFLTAIVRSDSIALYRALVCQAEKFPELGKKFYEFGPIHTTKGLAEYLALQVEKKTLDIKDPMIAAQQFLSMIAMTLIMEMATGARDSYSDKEISTHVDSTVDMFFKAYGV